MQPRCNISAPIVRSPAPVKPTARERCKGVAVSKKDGPAAETLRVQEIELSRAAPNHWLYMSRGPNNRSYLKEEDQLPFLRDLLLCRGRCLLPQSGQYDVTNNFMVQKIEITNWDDVVSGNLYHLLHLP